MAGNLLQFVNPLQGTDSHHGFSKGNTLPLIAMPFGMNHWSPQTSDAGGWFFSPRHFKLQGIRCTHQPSPWMGDYGAFTVMPQSGRRLLSAGRRASAYRPDRSVIKPHHFRAELIANGTVLEMSPTERGAIFRFTFPADQPARVILDPAGGESHVSVKEDRRMVVGYTRHNSGGVPEGFAHYFVAVFDTPIANASTFAGEETWEETSRTGQRVGIAVEFGCVSAPVLCRIATSFISVGQAIRNLELELGARPFEEILAAAEEVWEQNLGRIQVESENETAKSTFYSCLYRTQLFPRIWHEPTAEGVAHRSPYDGQVHPGVLYTDNGFWDTYRTEYPLLALLAPSRVAEIMQGWVNAYREGGWFPQWATPGYRACMVGTHIDAVMADAVARGVRDFDIDTALEGMLKHAEEIGDPKGAFGRIGIEDYKRLGYVSTEHHESVARSLDYAYDDWCIAQVAKARGRTEEAERLLERAGNYRHLWDPGVGFMRARDADGNWQEPWDEFWWGNPYVEGGPWQSSWAVQHDPAGLIELMGGDEAFVAKLDRMLATPPRFEVGAYGFEIHEMTEMACVDFGQYAHSNQPVHHVLYFYAAAGRPWRTQEEVRRVMRELYSPDGFAGDEDNGEMSAWYVLSALGIFPLCPGHPSWVLGSPLFEKATVHLESGRQLIVTAPQNSHENVFVRETTIDGELLKTLWVSHERIVAGGELRFEMSSHPNARVFDLDSRPYSCSVASTA